MTTQSLQLSHHFYNLFHALPDEAKQGFLTTLTDFDPTRTDDRFQALVAGGDE